MLKNAILNHFGFSLLLFLAIQNLAFASSNNEILNYVKEKKLSSSEDWLQLLHFKKNKSLGEIHSEDFYLSAAGKIDPNAELIALVNAYFQPWGSDPNQDSRCRFPGRYYWLSQHVQLPEYQIVNDKCQNLKKWALLDNVKSISLIMVSGYFGNPASTFGHSLLKLNTESSDDKQGLFDVTLNYGALVPENELIVKYIFRGLFGGYQAGFSDKYYYTQDNVYSHEEFRDMWEYKLNLSDAERNFLILHIWEVVGKKFTYYFLEKNCAYRLAELADITIPEKLINNHKPWYVPIEMFQKLTAIDQTRSKASSSLIDSVTFIPSAQRVLYYQLKKLNTQELKILNKIIKNNNVDLDYHLEGASTENKVHILDGLLAYQQYKLVFEGPKGKKHRQEEKEKILLARLHLPAHTNDPISIPDLPAPSDGSKPMMLGLGIASSTQNDFYYRVNFSPFKQERVGQNSLEGDEFVVLDLNMGILDDEEKIFIDKFDLVRILNLNTLPVNIVDDNQLSWGLRVGLDRIDYFAKSKYDGMVRFGAGPAKKLNHIFTTYTFFELSGHTIGPYLRMRPHAGLNIDLGKLRAWMYLGAENTDYSLNFKEIFGGKIQFQTSKESALFFEIDNDVSAHTNIGINLYW